MLAGPTAVGKGTVSRYIRENYPDVLLSVSATTRPPRPGEVDGVHYYFVDDAEFDRMIERGELLEYATVHNAYRYGTPRPPIDARARRGRSVLLEIDLQGARQVRDGDARGPARVPAAADLGRTGAPTGRPRHRGRGGAGAPAGDREGRTGAPRTSSM